jgi:hypothetical protein
MRTVTAIALAVIAGIVIGAVWYFGGPPAGVTGSASAPAGTLAFPGLAPKLATAAKVAVISKDQALMIARAGDAWSLTDKGGYPVRPDKLHELLTGLTELRLTEPRTSDPALLERLGLGDPTNANSTAVQVQVLDANSQVLAELILGHRRVRPQGNLSETIYVRRPGQDQAWLAEGQLQADTDPQLWIDRDIANIDGKKVASVVVHRGDAVLEFGRDGDKPVLKVPAEHPKLDDYRVEALFGALEMLTLTDVKPAAQQPGEKIGTAAITLTDGTVVEAAVSGVAKADAKEPGTKDIWAQFAVRGESDEAKKLAARVTGWAYQIGSWKEKAFVPTLDDLKAAEKSPAAAEEKKPAAGEAPAASP